MKQSFRRLLPILWLFTLFWYPLYSAKYMPKQCKEMLQEMSIYYTASSIADQLSIQIIQSFKRLLPYIWLFTLVIAININTHVKLFVSQVLSIHNVPKIHYSTHLPLFFEKYSTRDNYLMELFQENISTLKEHLVNMAETVCIIYLNS